MSIRRLDPDTNMSGLPLMVPADDGGYVDYDDHAAEVERRDLAYEDLKREYDHKCERVDTLQARVQELTEVLDFVATLYEEANPMTVTVDERLNQAYDMRCAARAALAAVDAEGKQP